MENEFEMKGIEKEEEEGDQETSFINEGFNPYDDSTGVEDEVIISEERNRRIRRGFDYKNAEDLFTNILNLGPHCSDHRFIDFLVDSRIFSIKRDESLTGDYSVKYLGGDFQSIGRAYTQEEIDLLRDGIYSYYDSWSDGKRNKILKKAGIITAIGLSIIALATGLSIALTRKGADMVHQAKKWEKLTPAEKIREKVIPWIELEKATGRVVIFTGEHIVIIVTLVGIYIYSK